MIHTPSLSLLEQQDAAQRIHQLLEQGISRREAITRVAQEIRTRHQGEKWDRVLFEEDE